MGLGANNQLLFRDPLDLMWFYNITVGHPIVMGRMTYESIGGPLPDRTNIVLSKTLPADDGIQVVRSIPELLSLTRDKSDDVYVIGGASVYKTLLPYCAFLHLTTFYEVPAVQPDCFFPAVDDGWRLMGSVVAGTFEDGSVRMRFESFKRR
ncbi:MAG: dihydrofolate reductase [Ruminococcus flavefaciens]|nr:dihydrofolate reductase [Ruminococcus flavefaciens]